MGKRYSLLEALLTEGAFEDRIQQVITRADDLLASDYESINPRDKNEYERSSSLKQFIDIVTNPAFPAAGKNVGYLNWGVSRIKECASAEISTIAEEISDLIKAHILLKGTQLVSPNIDDYRTPGDLRAAAEEAALSRQTKALSSESRKMGAQMLDAAIRMSDIIYIDEGVETDEEGLKNFGDSRFIIAVPKTRLASQVLGNPKAFGINDLGGSVRWCTSGTANSSIPNQFCNYTVRRDVFLIYVIDLDRPDSDNFQKTAFVFNPPRYGDAEMKIAGKPFNLEVFDNLDQSPPDVKRAALQAFGQYLDLMKNYVESRGGVPHLSKKAEEFVQGADDVEFVRGVAAEDLPPGYGVEALYDTMMSKMGEQDHMTGKRKLTGQIPPALAKMLDKDTIDRQTARRIINMFVSKSESPPEEIVSHFVMNVEDAKSVADAVMLAGSEAPDPESLSRIMNIAEMLASRTDLESDARAAVDDVRSKVDLMMARAIGRVSPDKLKPYFNNIEKTRYPAAIMSTFLPAANDFLDDPKNINSQNIQLLMNVSKLLINSPGAAGNRQIALKMIPLNSKILDRATERINKNIEKKALGSAKNLADFVVGTELASRPELRRAGATLISAANNASDLYEKNQVVKKSEDEEAVIEIINDPMMTRYCDVFDNPNITPGMASAAFERAQAENQLEDFITQLISAPGFLAGESYLVELARRAVDIVGPENPSAFAIISVLEDIIPGDLYESRRVARTKISRKRYSLARSLL